MKGKCPKDSLYSGEVVKECCEVSPDGFACVRPIGHKGKHHAHDINDKCYAVW